MKQLAYGFLSFFIAVALGIGGIFAYRYVQALNDDLDPEDANPMKRLFGPPNVAHIVVLERNGAKLLGGEDDSRHNISSVVATKQKAATIPKFNGSDQQWRDFVKCVRKVFAPYDIEVVEKRPERGSYVLAVVGGKPSAIGYEKRIAGLAPYNADVVDDPIAFVFADTLDDDPIKMCETAAEEIGHTYGLDHEYNCKDPMTYLKSCGTQSFQNVEAPCGEYKKRPCKDGKPTQNTAARLLSVLGPNKSRLAGGGKPTAAAAEEPSDKGEEK